MKLMGGYMCHNQCAAERQASVALPSSLLHCHCSLPLPRCKNSVPTMHTAAVPDCHWLVSATTLS